MKGVQCSHTEQVRSAGQRERKHKWYRETEGISEILEQHEVTEK